MLPSCSPRHRSQLGFQSSDATYHEKAGPKASTPAKPAEPLAESVSYPKSALTKIEILPAAIEFVGPRYSQRLVVEGTFADGHQEDLTPQAQIISSDGKIAWSTKTILCSRKRTASDGCGDGRGQRASASLDCEELLKIMPWSFRNDVLPVMTKSGMQLRAVPWRGGGQERIQVDAARLRSGNRLLHTHPPGAGAPDRADGTRQEFDPAETHADDSARRRKAFSDSAPPSTR